MPPFPTQRPSMSSTPGRPDRSMDWFANLKAQQIATLTQTWDALQKIPSESEIQFLGTVTQLQQDQVLWWFHARANQASVTKVFRQRRKEGAGDRHTLILPSLKEYGLFQQYSKGDPIQQRAIIKTPDPLSTAGEHGPVLKRRPGPRSKTGRTATSRRETSPTLLTGSTKSTKSTELSEPTEPTESVQSTKPTAIKRRRDVTAPPSDDDESPTFRTRRQRALAHNLSSTDTPAPKRVRSSTNAPTDSTSIPVSALLIRLEETDTVMEEDLVMESGQAATTATSPKVLRSSTYGSSSGPATRKPSKTTGDDSMKGKDVSEIEHQDNGVENPEAQTMTTKSGPRRGTRNRRPSHHTSTTPDNTIHKNDSNSVPTPTVEENTSLTNAKEILTSDKTPRIRRRGRSVATVEETNPIPTELSGTPQRGVSVVESAEAEPAPIAHVATRQRVQSVPGVADTGPVPTELTEARRRGRSAVGAIEVNPTPVDLVATRQRGRSIARVTQTNPTQPLVLHARSKAIADVKTTPPTTPKALRQRGRSKAVATSEITPVQSTESDQHDQSTSGTTDATPPLSESSNSHQRSRSMTRASWVDDLNMFAGIVPKFRTKTPVKTPVESPQDSRSTAMETGLTDPAAQFSVSGRDPRIAPGQPTPYSSPNVAPVTVPLQEAPITDMIVTSAPAARVAIPLFPVLHPGLSSDPRISHAVNMEPLSQPRDEQEAERRESRRRDAVRREQERERLQREDDEREEMERILRQNIPMESPWSSSPKPPSPTSPTLSKARSGSPPLFEPITSLATPCSFSDNGKYVARDLLEPSSKVNGSRMDPSRQTDGVWSEVATIHQRSDQILDQRSSNSSNHHARDDRRSSNSRGRRPREDHRTRDDSRIRSYRESRHERHISLSRSPSLSRTDRQSRYEHGEDHSRSRLDRHSRHGRRNSRSPIQSEHQSRDGRRDSRSHNRSDRKSRRERRDGRSRSRTYHKSRKDRPPGRSRSHSQRQSRSSTRRRSRHNHRASRSRSRSKQRRSFRREASPRQSPPRETSPGYYEHHGYSRLYDEQNQHSNTTSIHGHHPGLLEYAQPISESAHTEVRVPESLNEASTNIRGHADGTSGKLMDVSMESSASQLLMTAQEIRPLQRMMNQIEYEYRGTDPVVEAEKVTLDTTGESVNPNLPVEESEREMAEEPSVSTAISAASASARMESDMAPAPKAESLLFRQSRSHTKRSYRRSRPSTSASVEADIQHAESKSSETPADASIQIPANTMDRPPKSAQIQRMSMPDLETLAGSAKQNHPGIKSTSEKENDNDTTMKATVHSGLNSSTSTSTSTSTSVTPSASSLSRRSSRQPSQSANSPDTEVPQPAMAEDSAPVADNDKVVPVSVPETAPGPPERPRRKKKGKREIRDD